MMRVLLTMWLLVVAVGFGGENGKESPFVVPDRAPDYAASGAKADLSLYFVPYGPEGGGILCLLRIRVKAPCGFYDESLLRPVFTIRDEDGALVPFTRFGTGCYDHRTRIRYKGQLLLLEDYLKAKQADGAARVAKEENEKASEHPASYQNRLFILSAGDELLYPLDLSRLYDLSNPGKYVATADWSFITDSVKKDDGEKYVVDNIVLTVPPEGQPFRISHRAAGSEGNQVPSGKQ